MQAALHPTPAVCGRPRAAAKDVLACKEPFDRGFYSGPFGWLSGSAAEFVVAIRSGLIHPQRPAPISKQPDLDKAAGINTAADSSMHPDSGWASHLEQAASLQSTSSAGVQKISLFAGVGIVKGSSAEAEWQV